MKDKAIQDTAVQFGSVLWITAHCPVCKKRMQVIPNSAASTPQNPNGETYGCCGRPYLRAAVKITENRIDKGKNKHRRKPSPFAQRRILAQQCDRCLFCNRRFGSYVYAKGAYLGKTIQIRLKLVWDHYIPYVYCLDSSDANFVAACQICNQYKSDLMLSSVTEYQTYIGKKTARKFYDVEDDVSWVN
jgi:hypothetical protein